MSENEKPEERPTPPAGTIAPSISPSIGPKSLFALSQAPTAEEIGRALRAIESELVEARRDLRDRLRSLTGEQDQMWHEVRRLDRRIQDLETEQRHLREELRAASQKHDEYRVEVERTIEGIKRHIDESREKQAGQLRELVDVSARQANATEEATKAAFDAIGELRAAREEVASQKADADAKNEAQDARLTTLEMQGRGVAKGVHAICGELNLDVPEELAAEDGQTAPKPGVLTRLAQSGDRAVRQSLTTKRVTIGAGIILLLQALVLFLRLLLGH